MASRKPAKAKLPARHGGRRVPAFRLPADRELERFFTLTLDLLGIAGFDGYFKRVNPAWETTLGYSSEELLARPYIEFIHPDDRAATLAEAEKLTTGVPVITFENRYRCKDGSYKWLLWNSMPVPERSLIYAAARDITERRTLEKMKDEFVSMIGHELRTPLASIRGALGLLASGQMGALNEKGERMLHIAVEDTDRLIRLVNEVIDIERLELGRVKMVMQECDAAELVERAAGVMRPMAERAGMKLETASKPATVRADPDRILQTLTNLIGNAVKFSPPGSVVQVTAVPREQDVLFQVADRGRGIPAGSLEDIFERFHQVEAADSQVKGGAGLGLSISRKIVQQHGGRIWAKSAQGRGSVFSFTLPRAGRTSDPQT